MDLSTIVLVVPAAVIGLTVHEFAHAYTAYRLGDLTAKEMGRVSLNPLKHIDWFGFALIVIAGFGWAKPVHFNPDNLKNRQRDEILIAIAGPISNFLLAIVFIVLARLLYFSDFFNSTEMGAKAINMLFVWGLINIGLFLFNMIPIPPLDGSHLYLSYLKDTNPQLMHNLYRYGTFALFGIIILEYQLDIEILYLSDAIHGITGFLIAQMSF